MSWNIEYVPEKGLVAVTVSGGVDNDGVKAQTAEAIQLLKQHEASRILADYSNALSEASLPGLYCLPDYVTEQGAPWDLRLALVLPKTGYRLELYRFFELVFRNAGYNVRLFEAREPAEKWLAEVPRRHQRAAQSAHA
jgi:hypothetical protein